MEKHSNAVVRTKDVIGKSVINSSKEDLGKVDEIVLDKVSGQTRYVVLSFGGFLGLGDKLYAIPWKAISYDPEEDSFTLNADKERLKNAPGFDKDNWPDFADTSWGQKIHDFYHIKF